MKTDTYLRSYRAHFLFRMRNVFDKICKEIQNTYFVVNFFFSKIVLFMRQYGNILFIRTDHR